MEQRVAAARLQYQTYRMLALEILIVFVVPILTLKMIPVVFAARNYVMWTFLIYITAIIGWQKISIQDLGFSTTNFRQAFISLRLPTILMIVPIVLTAAIKPELLFIKEAVPMIQASLLRSILVYIVISVTAQELIFRSFAVARLSLVNRNKAFLIAAASLVFMVAHIPFDNPLFVFGSIGPGLVWTYFYIQNRNVYAVIISHMLVGLAAFLPTLLLIPR